LFSYSCLHDISAHSLVMLILANNNQAECSPIL
jgi:hypothetical protein